MREGYVGKKMVRLELPLYDMLKYRRYSVEVQYLQSGSESPAHLLVILFPQIIQVVAMRVYLYSTLGTFNEPRCVCPAPSVPPSLLQS